MNPARFALKNRTTMVVLTLLLIGCGIISYEKLGRLEDPTFTIKTALVVTPYAGATPSEVEEEVTDVIEEAIQEIGEVKKVYSTSEDGMSYVFVDIKDEIHGSELPQIWDELRRKINDCQMYLPSGAGPSIVNDDFGDVYGVYYAITAPGYGYAKLKDIADELKNELLLCEDVAKVNFWGLRQECIYVEYDRARMAELGIPPMQIVQTINNQNAVTQSGKVTVGDSYLRILPSGDFRSEDSIKNLLIGNDERLIRVSDVASVYRGYIEPPTNMMRYNGRECIGLGISTIDGGNVITMGESVKAKIDELTPVLPEGVKINLIYCQSDVVVEAVNMFVWNLAEAVVIVVVLLMIFMGAPSGLLIGFILLLNILGTFVAMQVMDITLQKISLGALILALGMLVDNAIVVAEGILIRVERGESRIDAAEDTVRDTRWPLLGATMIAILAFTAIGFSPGNVGEFCRSLFDVMAVSLLLSWILAVTVTPLLCVWFLKIPDIHMANPYDRPMFNVYRKMLHTVIKFRWLSLACVIAMLVLAQITFANKVPKAFFPDSTKSYFYVNYWSGQGTHIEKTASDLMAIERYVAGLDGVLDVTSFIGEGSLRFILSYDYESKNSSYGQILVKTDDYKRIDGLQEQILEYMTENFPDATPNVCKIPNGPGNTYKIQARLRGGEQKVLEMLAGQMEMIMKSTPHTQDYFNDWRTPTSIIQPDFSEQQARIVGISRSDLSNALQMNYTGLTTGVYRESDELLPIVFRTGKQQRQGVGQIADVQVWSPVKQSFIPISQTLTGISHTWQWPLIQRYNREKTITIMCNPQPGYNVAEVLQSIMIQASDIELPTGYSLEWGGEYESSIESQEPLAKIFPLCIIGMYVILLILFNSLRRSGLIMLIVPLALIGVAPGLMVLRMAFGFMAILGFLGLSGMLIKNAIVLIDQIEIDLKEGKPPYKAILDSSVSRMRPVVMASGTTILGMAPLTSDPLYQAMAGTIMSGLFAATFLTLFVVPVLYSLLFRIKPERRYLDWNCNE